MSHATKVFAFQEVIYIFFWRDMSSRKINDLKLELVGLVKLDTAEGLLVIKFLMDILLWQTLKVDI